MYLVTFTGQFPTAAKCITIQTSLATTVRCIECHQLQLLKVKNPFKGLDRHWGIQEVEATTFQDNLRKDVLRLYALSTSWLYSTKHSRCSFVLEAESTNSHSVVVRIMSKYSHDNIDNRTIDLPACSTVLTAKISCILDQITPAN
jgi:hypothetical protein